MSHFLLELISEEIPAFLQQPAAEQLSQVLKHELTELNFKTLKIFGGVRRITVLASIDPKAPAKTIEERGPKTTAPEQAKVKFSEKYGVKPSDLVERDGYWFLEKHLPETPAEQILAHHIPEILWNFKWAKALRWGPSQFQWIRPLRQIVCLIDDKVVPFSLERGDDKAYGLKSSNVSYGPHPRNAKPITISSASSWEETLKKAGVIASRADRLEDIEKQTEKLLEKHNLKANLSEHGQLKLFDELAGLTEDPVMYLGKIDESFMALPTEVRDLSMRAHQRYIPLSYRDTDKSAPFFAFAANGSFKDHGQGVITGNESVLTARLEDARHFWELDLKTKLEDRLDGLTKMSFHSKLGNQKERSLRLKDLSEAIAVSMNIKPHGVEAAARAGLLCKADLQSQMVGEFPELQGIMGAYYAENDHEDDCVYKAIRTQYLGKPTQDDKSMVVQASLAIADRLDSLAGFFGKDMKPSGSKDPYALRRKGNELLSWTQILEEKVGEPLPLLKLSSTAIKLFIEQGIEIEEGKTLQSLQDFFNERLRQFLPTNRKDIVDAIMAENTGFLGDDDTLENQAIRVQGLEEFISTSTGEKLMQACKRLCNILESNKEKVETKPIDVKLFTHPSEEQFYKALEKISLQVREQDFLTSLKTLSSLADPLNTLLENVMVFDDNKDIRDNRVNLLEQARKLLISRADLRHIQVN